VSLAKVELLKPSPKGGDHGMIQFSSKLYKGYLRSRLGPCKLQRTRHACCCKLCPRWATAQHHACRVQNSAAAAHAKITVHGVQRATNKCDSLTPCTKQARVKLNLHQCTTCPCKPIAAFKSLVELLVLFCHQAQLHYTLTARLGKPAGLDDPCAAR
jgi:hypothetical protein